MIATSLLKDIFQNISEKGVKMHVLSVLLVLAQTLRNHTFFTQTVEKGILLKNNNHTVRADGCSAP